MTVATNRIPGWLRLLERPRRLHRLASSGLLLAAVVAGADAFVRSAPGGPRPDVLALTYLFDIIVWLVVLAAAAAEAFVAGLSAPRLTREGRPHYTIVLVTGLGVAGLLLLAHSLLDANLASASVGVRLVKAAIIGILPLVVGVALTAGGVIAWVAVLRPQVEARLEAQVREYERQRRGE